MRLAEAFGFDAYNPMEIASAKLEPKADENSCPSTVLADSLKASSSSLLSPHSSSEDEMKSLGNPELLKPLF